MQKVKISGSYRTKNKEVVDYEIEGIVPDCDRDVLESVTKTRYAKMWLMNSKKYKDRVYDKIVRETYIDSVEKVEGTPSFVGKNLKELTFEEMQDLATAKGIREIPLYKSGSLRSAQIKCYRAFASKILGKEISMDANYDELEDYIIDDGKTERKVIMPMTNDEYLDREEKRMAMSLDELKKLADAKEIKYHPNIGFDKLYAKVYD